MCVVTVVAVMAVGGRAMRERGRVRMGEGFVYLCCVILYLLSTLRTKRSRHREREIERGGDDGGMLANSMSGSRGRGIRSQQRREGWTDR